MELVLEDVKKMYIDESLNGAVARLYDENGILEDQKEFSAEFLYSVLFKEPDGGVEE